MLDSLERRRIFLLFTADASSMIASMFGLWNPWKWLRELAVNPIAKSARVDIESCLGDFASNDVLVAEVEGFDFAP